MGEAKGRNEHKVKYILKINIIYNIHKTIKTSQVSTLIHKMVIVLLNFMHQQFCPTFFSYRPIVKLIKLLQNQ